MTAARRLAVLWLGLVACSAKVDEPQPASSAARATTRSSATPSEVASVPDRPLSSAELAQLHDYVVDARSSADLDPAKSPEAFASSMVGAVPCNARSCKAGKEICVAAPSPDFVSHCEPIVAWVDHKTPKPRGGFPAMAGVSACDGSENCPPGTVCCLHEIGDADVQAIVCHAAVSECRDGKESCSKEGAPCRTPGTTCDGIVCVKR